MTNQFYVDFNIKEKEKTSLPTKDLIFILVTLFIYFLLFLGAGAYLNRLVAYIYSSANSLDYNTLIESLSNLSKVGTEVDGVAFTLPDGYLFHASVVTGLGNLTIYLICISVALPLLFKFLIADIKKFKTMGVLKSILTIIGSFLAFFCIVLLVSNISSQFAKESTNQNTIVLVMKNGGMAPMLISTVLIAPLLEELIYRKCLFTLFRNFNPVVKIIISALVFSIPHMLSTAITNPADIIPWICALIPYLISGIMLGFIYNQAEDNIYVSLSVHFLNNTISLVNVLASMSIMGVLLC